MNIFDIINNIKSKKVKLRKATIEDFNIESNNIKECINDVRIHKNQREYGQKKFIKP